MNIYVQWINVPPYKVLCYPCCLGNFYLGPCNYILNSGNKNCLKCLGTSRITIPLEEFDYDESKTPTVLL